MDALLRGNRYLFIRSITEPTPHSLSVIVAEGEVSLHEEVFSLHGLEGRPIRTDADCPLLEIAWSEVVTYLVLDERYTLVGPATGDDGKPVSMLEQVKNSEFLRYMKQISFADNEHPGPLMHFRLCSLTHIIDVVSVHHPTLQHVTG